MVEETSCTLKIAEKFSLEGGVNITPCYNVGGNRQDSDKVANGRMLAGERSSDTDFSSLFRALSYYYMLKGIENITLMEYN